MRTHSQRLALLFFILGLISSSTATAFNWPRMMVSGRFNNYLGEKGKSFSESARGYGIGFTFLYDYSYRMAPFLGGHYHAIEGKQSFYDDEILTPSSFILHSTTLEAGLNYYTKDRGNAVRNYFFSGAAIFGKQALGLSKTLTFQRLPRTDEGVSTGARLGFGMDWNLKTNSFSSKKKWSITTEIAYRKEITKLINQNLSLDSIMLSLGLCW